ncbi:DUF488 domain-containing protein [Labrys neptuniae]
MPIGLKRAYDPPASEDGLRILVDRLWPRGLSRQEAHIDIWAKDVAPSSALRKWFGHDPAKWWEFQALYESELAHNSEAVMALRRMIGDKVATLVYAARDVEHTHAIVTKRVLEHTAF